MKGTRPLNNDEIQRVSECFDGTFEIRNRSLFMLGVSTGGRISELLSLKIEDVYQNGKPVTALLFDRSIVKGGEMSRTVPMNTDAKRAIENLMAWHTDVYEKVDPSRPLFPSRKGAGLRGMNRRTAHTCLKLAFEKAGLNGKLATHSLRKSFAQRLYDQIGDIYAVQEMLGHRSVVTTQKYLGVNYENVSEAIEAMSVAGERDRTVLSSHSLVQVPDDTLLIELLKRGYDVSSVIGRNLRDTLETPEIRKILEGLTTGESV